MLSAANHGTQPPSKQCRNRRTINDGQDRANVRRFAFVALVARQTVRRLTACHRCSRQQCSGFRARSEDQHQRSTSDQYPAENRREINGFGSLRGRFDRADVDYCFPRPIADLLVNENARADENEDDSKDVFVVHRIVPFRWVSCAHPVMQSSLTFRIPRNASAGPTEENASRTTRRTNGRIGTTLQRSPAANAPIIAFPGSRRISRNAR